MALPIIPWIGVKRRLAEKLIPNFPPHSCYVEVFAGGAALYFLRQPVEVEVINDISGELFNLYRVVKNHLKSSCGNSSTRFLAETCFIGCRIHFRIR